MSQIEKEMQTLTIKDKVNMSYLLARQIITFQQAILMPNSEKDIKEAINGLVEMIPDAWKDKEWNEEIEKAKEVKKIDNRPFWCGTRIRADYCTEPYIYKTQYDANKLFHCVINLLFRRGLLSQVNRIEKVLGEGWDGEE